LNESDVGWRAYIDAITVAAFTEIPGDTRLFDVIFVDGRWRPACALTAAAYMGPDSVLVMHDWQREWYHQIMPYFIMVV
jgi:hypothetical protein